MRSVLVRLIAVFFAVVLFAPTNGYAGTIRTIDFVGTVPNPPGDFFTVLGIDAVDTVTGSFSFDTMAAAHFETTFGSGVTERDFAQRPYTSYFFNLGGTILTAASSLTTDDSMWIQDGIGSGRVDSFFIQTNTDVEISTGLFLTLSEFSLSGLSENLFTGTSVPSVAELDTLTAGRSIRIAIGNLSGSVSEQLFFTNVTLSEVSPVPLPAALPLLASALAGFGFVGWRRRRAALAG